jgi:CPA1 family monovalent cation:H+ antiporter
MGMVIGWQRRSEVRELLEFNEAVRTLLIAGLFVILGARLTTDQIASLHASDVVFVLGLVLVARPLAVAICTLGSRLSWQQRVFAGWMAPRGIVAASVSAVFALRLEDVNEPGGATMVPTVFLTIVLTIAIYGLTAPVLALRLGLADPTAQGLLILGAGPLAVAIGIAVRDQGFRVLLTDTDTDAVTAARVAGLEVYEGAVLSDLAQTELDLRGIGSVLAVTTNREAAAMASLYFGRTFGRRNVFMVPVTPRPGTAERNLSANLQARRLDTKGLGVAEMSEALTHGAVVRVQAAETPGSVPLLAVTRGHRLLPLAADARVALAEGESRISFVPAATDQIDASAS